MRSIPPTPPVTVQFLPTATGTRTGVLTLYGNVPGGQATAALTGSGAPAAPVVLSPVLVTFPQTTVGATSSTQEITVSNTGGITVILGTPFITGDFLITANTCGATLAPSTGCTLSIGFRPTASGTRTGTLTISGSEGTQTASLTGISVLPATDALAPLALSFGPQQLTTSSSAQSIALTNAGDQALQLIAAQTTGNFTVVNACGNSLNGHSSCVLQVAFVPRALGPDAGVLTVSDQYRSQTVSLSGTGIAPPGVSIAPLGPLGFAATGVGSTSSAQTVTLTNNSVLPLSIQGIAVTGDFAIVAGSNTCGTALAAYTACTLQVVFSPSAGGTRSGALTFSDNSTGSPQSITLLGTGIDFTLAADGSTSASIPAGQQAVYPLLLSSAADIPGTVSFTCSPLPANATCNISPGNATLGSDTVLEVTIDTSVSTAQLAAPVSAVFGRRLILAAALLPLGLLAGRRRGLGGALLLLCLCAIPGCSASRLIPGTSTGGSGIGSTNPTPSGTYTITVTGTSAGLSRSVNLTLIVQ